MANADFNTANFLQDVAPMMRRKKITYAVKDIVNQFIFTRRQQLNPNFIIPASHVSRWQAIQTDSSSDSAQSEVDSDEGILTILEQNKWINELIGHIQVIFGMLNNAQSREFAIEVIDRFGFSVKKRTRLNIM